MSAAAPAATGRTVTDAADRRKRDLARIHLLKAELRLGEDEYRDLLQAVARVRSAADLDWTGRRRVLDHLGKLRRALKKEPETSVSRQQRLVRFLWHGLAEAGALRLPAGSTSRERELALGAWIKRQTGVAALAWLSPAQLREVIEMLKRWSARSAPAETAATAPAETA